MKYNNESFLEKNFSSAEEEVESLYQSELTPDEKAMFERLQKLKEGKKTTKAGATLSYNSNMRKNIQNVLQTDFVDVNGQSMTVGEKIAMGVAVSMMRKASKGKLSVGELVELEKATGEYTETKQVEVSGLEKMLQSVEDDNDY